MLSRAARICDWIEASCAIPEGPLVGEWFVLLPFQTEIFYRVYNNAGGQGQTVLPDVSIEVPGRCGRTLKMTENQILRSLLEERDVEAMREAMRLLTKNPRRLRQIGRMMDASRPQARVGAFAAYVCQQKSLELLPHQVPPCHVNDPACPEPGEEGAAQLLSRMLAADISKWTPDPQAALAAVAN